MPETREEFLEREEKQKKATLELWGMLFRLIEYPEWGAYVQLGEARLRERDNVTKKQLLSEEDVRMHNFAIGECAGIELMLRLPYELKERYDIMITEAKRNKNGG